MIFVQTALLSLVISSASDTVLLDFYGDTCPPCRQMAPTVERLAKLGYPVRKVNCSREPELASRFGVTGIPCFVMIVNGREVDRVVGATSLARLETMCRMGVPRTPNTPGASPTELASATSSPGERTQVIPAVNSGLTLGALSSADGSPDGAKVADLVGATVRLRIEDATGHSCGSGTIIDARDGEALILTCGHIFRDSKGKGRIDVDVFGPAPAQKVPGRILHYDLETDIGLLTIRTTGPVKAARVAPPGHRIAKGAAVINVGCNNGEQPTARRSHITAIDKFMGPPNLEVAGLPVQGRSGGGLFSSEGYVIGVCNAADPSGNEGLYAALSAIHSQLDRLQLSFIYQAPEKAATAVVASEPPPMARQMPRAEEAVALTEVAAHTSQPAVVPASFQQTASDPASSMTDRERAALEEIHKRKQEGAEVICVIRPRNDPKAQSEIIVLDKVSPAFLHQLSADPRPQGRLTSLDVPNSAATPAAPAAMAPLANRSQPDGDRANRRTILEYTAPPAGAPARGGW